jgi:acyl-CoA thioester hydrolase
MISFRDYRHVIPIQVRFSDIDKLDHVNNACYHNYIELGRVQYFEKILAGHINWDESGFVLARTEMDHLEQAYLHDELYCFTRVYRFGNKSIGVRNSIVKKESGSLIECAAVNAVLVAMDYRKNESIVVPQRWRELIAGFEGLQP